MLEHTDSVQKYTLLWKIRIILYPEVNYQEKCIVSM